MDSHSSDEEKPQEHTVSPKSSQTAKEEHGNTQQHGIAAVSAKLKNPLSGFSKEELMEDVERFAKEKGLEDILDLLRKGALIAQDPKRFEEVEGLDDNERQCFQLEKTKRWHQPVMMYWMTGK